MTTAGWHTRERPLPSPQGRRYEIFESDAPLSFERALSLLANEAGFRRWFSETLAQSDFAAYRWETPPLSKSLASRRFEFALVEDRGLERAPDESAFAAYFPDTPHNVVAVQNLSRTSDLIVPRRIAAASAYPHLAAFLRGAPAEQVDALWRCVAETVNRRLSDRPLWLSTAGAGVAWLHVRVDPVPKYYAYRPYREDALRD